MEAVITSRDARICLAALLAANAQLVRSWQPVRLAHRFCVQATLEPEAAAACKSISVARTMAAVIHSSAARTRMAVASAEGEFLQALVTMLSECSAAPLAILEMVSAAASISSAR